MTTTIALQNLGCSKNVIDGEKILHFFTSSGFAYTEEFSEAEIIIVNTCAFIREAQEEAIETILAMAAYKTTGSCSKLIVCGCFSQRFRSQAQKQLPEVDLWAGVNDWQAVLSEITNTKSDEDTFKRTLFEPISTQYLKIAEGCSHQCSFCIIPSIRGKFISRTPDNILAEAKWLYAKGTRELILVAQDTTRYGYDIGLSLVRLLENLLRNTKFPWIRMMYLHPQFVTDDLLNLVASEKRICSYFDIPLQHIADPILRSMKRTPLSAKLYQLIEKIRNRIPDAAIRSSFIIGYPGETAKHFRQLMEFIEFARFDKLGVFPFSPEEGTAAFNLRPRPANKTVLRRCEELMTVQREISRESLEACIGQEIEVIIDRVSDDHDFNFEARSQFDAPEVDGKVLIRSGSFSPGSIVRVGIIGASDYDLYADR